MKMHKTLDNFIKEVNKLDKYLLLHEEPEDYLILGTKIRVKIQKEMIGSPFSTYTNVIEKEYYVYFKIAFGTMGYNITEFNYLPTLHIPSDRLNSAPPVKESKDVKKYNAERFVNRTPPILWDEFDLLDKVEEFVDKTYLS
jgi:hypothetical protein